MRFRDLFLVLGVPKIAVIPYIPLRSLRSLVGVADSQWAHLGFRVIPGSLSGSTSVYEDDGKTTAYLASLDRHTVVVWPPPCRTHYPPLIACTIHPSSPALSTPHRCVSGEGEGAG